MTIFDKRLDRRRFLLSGLGGFALAGTAGIPRAAEAAPAKYGVATVRLCWINNVEFAGEFIADQRGYYAQEGFTASKLLSGGPSATPIEADLLQNKCLLGLSAPDITASAIAEGGELRTIGATYQKNAFCIMSLASKPILEPKQMVGKKIGVQATNQPAWNVLLGVNGIDPGSVQAVPVQFDPAPLAAGEVDGWIAFVTNEPNTLKVKGIDTVNFLFADHGYPLVNNTFVVRASSLTEEREAVKAVMRAEIRGWRDAIRDPAAGAKLAVETYGKSLGLDVAEQTLQSRSQNALITGPMTATAGLFTVAPDLVEKNVAALKLSGVDVKAEQLFDGSILAEIYKEDPSLLGI